MFEKSYRSLASSPTSPIRSPNAAVFTSRRKAKILVSLVSFCLGFACALATVTPLTQLIFGNETIKQEKESLLEEPKEFNLGHRPNATGADASISIPGAIIPDCYPRRIHNETDEKSSLFERPNDFQCSGVSKKKVTIVMRLVDWMDQHPFVFRTHTCGCDISCTLLREDEERSQGRTDIANQADAWMYTNGGSRPPHGDDGGRKATVWFGMEPQGWPELTRTPSSYQYIASINNPANVFPDTRPPPSHIIQVTYPDHLPSEFQAPSAKYHRELELKQLKFAQEYTGNADTPVVLYMSSRCEGWRDEWVRRLMASGIAVVSTGHCIKSQQASALFPECTNDKSIHGGHPEMRKSKMCLMENFKFTLAIDNTLEPDYITEKLFDPLRSPTLPVYMGASNALSEYSPAEEGLKAWVDARDFGAGDDHGDGPGGRWHGIPELAAYLRLLHRNSSLYASYFTWKDRPLNPHYLSHVWANSFFQMPCLVCERMAGATRRDSCA